MGQNSNIEWTDHTFNPWWGCDRISPGCDHCYAEREAARFHPHLKLWGHDAARLTFTEKHWSGPLLWNQRAVQDRKRYRVFCLSMGDVFDHHPTAVDLRPKLWNLIRCTPHLDWLLLTKRVGNAGRMLPLDWGDRGYPNVWLGYSPSSQIELDRDVPKLLRIPAVVHFLSCEPLLESLDLRPHLWGRAVKCDDCPHNSDCLCLAEPRLKLANEPAISWVIVGGESGSKARWIQPDWVRRIRDDCLASGVPFFFKQWGQLGGVRRKAEAGRELDGRTWDMIPEPCARR